MLIALLTLVAVVPQSGQGESRAEWSALRHPTVSTAGNVAFEMNGDLWMLVAPSLESPKEFDSLRQAVQLTSGPAWDREPAWGPDGTTLVFASDRAGTFDLWSLALADDGSVGSLTRLTDGPDAESEPAVGPDGSIVFVRGRDAQADLWLRAPDGNTTQVTSSRGAERSPTFAPNGKHVAYVSLADGRHTLWIRSVNGDSSWVVLDDLPVEYPSWAPDGDVIAFATRGRRDGVWIVPLNGSFTNLVSSHRARPAWSADGAWLALAAIPPPDPGYNGDPDRLGDRTVGEVGGWHGRLSFIRAPSLPGAGTVTVSLVGARDRAAHNAEAFDRVWARLTRLYGSAGNRAAWQTVRDRYRALALRAESDSLLDEIIYHAVRERPPARVEASGRAAVSSAHPLATRVGLAMLERGGNVIDAAVAISFALGVVEPDASGIGGYGEMVLQVKDMNAPVVIEFLTRVPEAATLTNGALLQAGRLPPDGPLLANVPGTVAGMWLAWERYGSGSLAWAELVEPAIRLAEDGFLLDEAFATTLSRERERFLAYESSAALFFSEGEPLAAGDTLRNPDLAWTLRQIADGGADAFYRGAVAQRMVADLRGHGSAMTPADVARYFAVEREPVRGTYRGYTVYGAAPAASGGVSLVAKLHLLEHWQSAGLYRDDAAMAHAMIEAWKLAPSTAGRVADPGLWPVDLEPFTDREAARARWERCFDPERATGPEELRRGERGPVCGEEELAAVLDPEADGCEGVVAFRAGEVNCRAMGTTAFAVADANGDLVAVTQTLGTWGGNFYVSPGLGFLYNDKLRSYRTDIDAYGARLPYARHGTSIAPTLVFDGTGNDQRPLIAVGAAGNAWITSAVYQVIAAMTDGGIGPQAALELPRFLVGVRRDGSAVRDVVIQIEDGFAPSVVRSLEAMGHRFQPISLRGELRMGYGAAVLIEDGRVRAGADPRRSGSAGAVNGHRR